MALAWQHGGREHRDPFDRTVAATALDLDLAVVSSERAFASFDGLALRPLRAVSGARPPRA